MFDLVLTNLLKLGLSPIELIKTLLFFLKELGGLPFDIITLIPDVLNRALLLEPLLLVFLMGCANSREHSIIHFAKLATDPILLEALEHTLEICFIDQSDRRELG